MKNPYLPRAFKFCKTCYKNEAWRRKCVDYTDRILISQLMDFASAQAMQALEGAYEHENNNGDRDSPSFMDFIWHLSVACTGCDYKEPRIAKTIAEKTKEGCEELKKIFKEGEGY